MPDDSQNTNELSDHIDTGGAKEDAETTAARRELKQTSISEKGGSRAGDEPASDDEGSNQGESPARTKTPEPEMRSISDDNLREQVSSPKKKRAHDQLDEHKDPEDTTAAEQAAGVVADSSVVPSRTDRSEPEKKRQRDKHTDNSGTTEVGEGASATHSARSSLEKPLETGSETAVASKGATDKEVLPPASAFSKSAFGKLASSSTSPFGALGGSGSSSVFGSGSSASPSPFAAASTAKSATALSAPKLSFGSGSTAGAASPFSGINGQSTGFGGALGGGAFGSVLSGPRLTSFAKPGEAFKNDKPSKPFGAPESDDDDASDTSEEDREEGSGGEEPSDNEAEKEKEKDKDESKTILEDKKKPKLQKVIIDDGEAGEVTLLQVRAKMYMMEKGVGWKERGAGMLKVNVPESSVEFDELGNPKPESFDASVLETEDGDGETKGRKNVRLILRQDHTLRVILNTAILPAMEFHLTRRLKSSLVLFMTFDGKEAKQVQVQMSEVNATALTDLMKAIQKQLQDV